MEVEDGRPVRVFRGQGNGTKTMPLGKLNIKVGNRSKSHSRCQVAGESRQEESQRVG